MLKQSLPFRISLTRHLRFDLPASLGGPTDSSQPLHLHLRLDITPVPACKAAATSNWRDYHNALLGPRLHCPDRDFRYPADEERTLQLTGSEVQLIRAQQAPVKAVMRALRAWRSYGVPEADGFLGAACEVLVMAAARPGRLVNPLQLNANGFSCSSKQQGQPDPVKPLMLFMDTLRLMRDQLRTSNTQAIFTPVYYQRASWLPARVPFTPIILNAAGVDESVARVTTNSYDTHAADPMEWIAYVHTLPPIVPTGLDFHLHASCLPSPVVP